MAAGLQVMNEQGHIILSLTDDIGKYLGTAFLNSASGMFADTRIDAGRLWYCYIGDDYDRAVPEITQVNGGFVWRYDYSVQDCTVMYGIY